MEAKDAATARVWLQQIGEARLNSGRPIAEWQWLERCGKRFRDALAVLLGLDLDSDELFLPSWRHRSINERRGR